MTAAFFMEDTNSLIEQRRAKLKSLEAKGIFPFRNKFTPDSKCNDARSGFESGALPEGTRVSVAGRITAHREMGKSMFVDVRDQSGRIQVYAQKNALGDDQFNIFTHLDLGDFIGVTGTLFRTKTGEPSLKLESFTIVAKSLRPPPAKWHGLEDTEIRYRQRYLDLIANPAVKDVFLKRSAIVHEIRAFFHSRGYVEVETPAMQAIPGGAAAQPFKTKHNALGCDFYLRIALELYHKRLLVGGIDKLFEIGKNFRNEGLSRRHNPEFTMLEAYQAFGDYETMMETVESLITTVAQKVVGTLVIEHNQDVTEKAAIQHALQEVDAISTTMTGTLLKATDGNTAAAFVKNIGDARTALVAAQDEIGKKPSHEVAQAAITAILTAIGTIGLHKMNLATGDKSIEDILASAAVRFDGTVAALEKLSTPKVINLTSPWKRARYNDLVKEKAGADWFTISAAERRQKAHDMGAEIGKEFEDFEVTNAVFSKFIEPTLINPTFVTHLPKELVPLAKLSPEDPASVEVFECCINGQEISPGYTEQNDPIAQRSTLEHQAGGEQQKLDEDFLVALEHGMPPAGGIGIGIDRLCMMLLGQESIRDVILFPQLKPK
ncbi:MAG TPA: lysine--tRNA ligase [Candidatus Acidoferrales bacterium]|jgi:lysyl-tRNA synthetase|nr:lysine--tRNA ligase [Candidatus Acidoferrales bacterium]